MWVFKQKNQKKQWHPRFSNPEDHAKNKLQFMPRKVMRIGMVTPTAREVAQNWQNYNLKTSLKRLWQSTKGAGVKPQLYSYQTVPFVKEHMYATEYSSSGLSCHMVKLVNVNRKPMTLEIPV